MTSNEMLAGMCEGHDKLQKEIRRGGRENVQDSLDSISGPGTAIQTCEKCTPRRSFGLQHVCRQGFRVVIEVGLSNDEVRCLLIPA